jgi:hypothetical protein
MSIKFIMDISEFWKKHVHGYAKVPLKMCSWAHFSNGGALFYMPLLSQRDSMIFDEEVSSLKNEPQSSCCDDIE